NRGHAESLRQEIIELQLPETPAAAGRYLLLVTAPDFAGLETRIVDGIRIRGKIQTEQHGRRFPRGGGQVQRHVHLRTGFVRGEIHRDLPAQRLPLERWRTLVEYVEGHPGRTPRAAPVHVGLK